ncbi:MAG: transcriptional regulator [Alphaproteobacteria bacterium]|nr:MAG: transcriptional regulator [Alphaproteobacteria bacterium]
MKPTRAKSYNQSCSVARALDVVGDRWTLLIVRELLTGPKRYSELRRYLAGMNATLLSDRLKQLESDGLVHKIDLAAGARASAYALTQAGAALEPVILALVRWGLVHAPAARGKAQAHPHWAVVAMRALFDPSRAAGLDIACQFIVGGQAFYAVVKRGTFASAMGHAPMADVTVTCSAQMFAAFDGSVETARALIDSGKVALAGSRRDFLRFAACFRLPAPVR